jgi:hypothetical protein
MGIKTRQSGRTIKTFDRAGDLAQKTKDGVADAKQAVEQTLDSKHLSEVDYASDKIKQTEERLGGYGIVAAEKLGWWGVRETRRLLHRYLRKGGIPLGLPTNRIHAPKTRAALSSGKLVGNTIVKTSKTSAKAAQKAMMATKKAIQTIIKWGKEIIKAIVSVIKTIIVIAKDLFAIILACGWVAVLIIIVIILFAVVGGVVMGTV